MTEHVSLRGLARFKGGRIRVKAAIPSGRTTPDERGREQKKKKMEREAERRRGQIIRDPRDPRAPVPQRPPGEFAPAFEPEFDLEGIFGGFGQMALPPEQPAVAPMMAPGISPMMTGPGGASPKLIGQILESAQGLISPDQLKKLTVALQKLLPS